METGKDNGNAEGRIRENVRYYGAMGDETLSGRIAGLEQEWDQGRVLAVAATGVGMFGLIAGLVGGRSWRLLTWVSLPMLFLHSLGKWVPAIEALRRMGVRSCREIEEEKYALKALRGDFKDVEKMPGTESQAVSTRATRALEAVMK